MRNPHPPVRFLAATLLVAASGALFAQAPWPNGPITVIVPFAAGGTGDVLGRLIASKLSEGLGQPVVVEFKPGAGTTLGTDFVALIALPLAVEPS